MNRGNIYIRMIYGGNILVSVNAGSIHNKCYGILNDEEYADPDLHHLFEFYPADIVKVDNRGSRQ